MLRRIKIEDLKEGMKFSEPLLFDDGKNRVLGKMSPLSQRELSVLKKWEVPFVMTEGSLITNNNKQIEKTENAAPDATSHAESKLQKDCEASILQLPDIAAKSDLYTAYLSIVQSVDAFLNDIKEKKPIQTRPVDGITLKLRTLLTQNRSLMISFILSAKLPEYEMAKNLTDTAILADSMSIFLELTEDQINDIVIAALLHDCGMLKVPQNILTKKEKLTDTEMQAVASHTIYGYKSILSEFMYTEHVALSVLQHHERWDGKGYPRGISKNAIALGARIIAVADAFVAMTTEKAYRKALLGYDAMKTLLADKGRRFDYEVIKAMIQCTGVYPIGSIVLLNDTSIARVDSIPPQTPLKPLVKILVNEQGTQFPDNTGDLLDLREYSNTFIVSAVDPQMYENK